MFSYLQIYEPRERAMVGLADVAVAPVRLLAWTRRRANRRVRRILLLRLERIGDLLMVLDAISDVRAIWPDADVELAVGSWNAPLARLIPGISRFDVIDAPWLARGTADASWPALIAHARAWRRRAYDLVINFEPDIRSNFLAWLSRAPVRVGYSTGGGGAFLTRAASYAPTEHASLNAQRLVAHAAGHSGSGVAPPPLPAGPRLTPPHDAVERARTILSSARGPIIGIHASGGRESKQWHLDRFAQVGRELARAHGATIVLTGSPADAPLVSAVRGGLADIPVIDASRDLDLPTLAALLSCLDLLVTGDTGPMHLAAIMDTPIVALFGPSDPRRYGPLARRQRVLRIDLPCSPCGRVRLPPAWCRGHVPACLDGLSVDTVVAAANDLLAETRAANRSVSASA